jgi:amidase
MIEPSWRDPWHVPAPFDGPRLETPIRVAVVKDPASQGTSAHVAAGVEQAARTLAEAGYAVEEVEPPRIADAAQAWMELLGCEIHMLWPQMQPIVSEGANRFMLKFLDIYPMPALQAYAQSLVTRSAILRAWAEFQQRYPLIVAPICTDPPFSVGTDEDAGGIQRIVKAMRMVVTVNLLGLPAVAVPVGESDGLPQVVQIVGRRFREDTCLDAAEAIEHRRGQLTPIDPR